MNESQATAPEPVAAPCGGGSVLRDAPERSGARRHDAGPEPDVRAALGAPGAALGSPYAPPLVSPHAPPLVSPHAPPLVSPHAPPLVSPHAPPLVPGGAGARFQRASLPELFAGIVSPARDETGGLLVEDDARAVTSGQLRKADFMRLLRAEVCRVAEDELRRAGRPSKSTSSKFTKR
jgi:hypothetical protein